VIAHPQQPEHDKRLRPLVFRSRRQEHQGRILVRRIPMGKVVDKRFELADESRGAAGHEVGSGRAGDAARGEKGYHEHYRPLKSAKSHWDLHVPLGNHPGWHSLAEWPAWVNATSATDP
jgi:hypothetical protein